MLFLTLLKGRALYLWIKEAVDVQAGLSKDDRYGGTNPGRMLDREVF